MPAVNIRGPIMVPLLIAFLNDMFVPLKSPKSLTVVNPARNVF